MFLVMFLFHDIVIVYTLLLLGNIVTQPWMKRPLPPGRAQLSQTQYNKMFGLWIDKACFVMS